MKAPGKEQEGFYWVSHDSISAEALREAAGQHCSAGLHSAFQVFAKAHERRPAANAIRCAWPQVRHALQANSKSLAECAQVPACKEELMSCHDRSCRDHDLCLAAAVSASRHRFRMGTMYQTALGCCSKGLGLFRAQPQHVGLALQVLSAGHPMRCQLDCRRQQLRQLSDNSMQAWQRVYGWPAPTCCRSCSSAVGAWQNKYGP